MTSVGILHKVLFQSSNQCGSINTHKPMGPLEAESWWWMISHHADLNETAIYLIMRVETIASGKIPQISKWSSFLVKSSDWYSLDQNLKSWFYLSSVLDTAIGV